MNVSLTPQLNDFIQELVDSGSYASASEVVREALRLLESEKEQIEWLRTQMAEARAEIDRGEVVRQSETFWDDLRQEAKSRIAIDSPMVERAIS